MSIERLRTGIGGVQWLLLASTIALSISAGATTTLPDSGREVAVDPPQQNRSSQFIEHIYRAHGSSPIWINQAGLTEKAIKFVDYIAQIETDGLDRKRYHYREITRLVQKRDPEEVEL